MKEEHWPYTLIWILSIAVIIVFVIVQSGCSLQVGARGEAYWPKENKDNVWRSRAEFHRKTSQTDDNMGAYK